MNTGKHPLLQQLKQQTNIRKKKRLPTSPRLSSSNPMQP